MSDPTIKQLSLKAQELHWVKMAMECLVEEAETHASEKEEKQNKINKLDKEKK